MPSGFLRPVGPSSTLDFFDRCIKARLIMLSLKRDLFHGVLTHKSALVVPRNRATAAKPSSRSCLISPSSSEHCVALLAVSALPNAFSLLLSQRKQSLAEIF